MSREIWLLLGGARRWIESWGMGEEDWRVLRDQALMKWQRLCSPQTINAAFLKGQLDRDCQTLFSVIQSKLIKKKGSLTKWDFLELMASMAELRRRGHCVAEFDQWMLSLRKQVAADNDDFPKTKPEMTKADVR